MAARPFPFWKAAVILCSWRRRENKIFLATGMSLDNGELSWTMLCRAHVASKTTAFLGDLLVLAAGFTVPLRHCNLYSGSQCANEVVPSGLLNRGEGYAATGLTQWIVRRNRATRGMTPWVNIRTRPHAEPALLYEHVR
jgi:hypothetical protein